LFEDAIQDVGMIWFGCPVGLSHVVSLSPPEYILEKLNGLGTRVDSITIPPREGCDDPEFSLINFEHFKTLFRGQGIGSIFLSRLEERPFMTIHVSSNALVTSLTQASTRQK